MLGAKCEYGLFNGQRAWLKGHSSENDRVELFSSLESLPMVDDRYYLDSHSAAEISLNCMTHVNVQKSYMMLTSKYKIKRGFTEWVTF